MYALVTINMQWRVPHMGAGVTGPKRAGLLLLSQTASQWNMVTGLDY
jgi:hypothetical protein